METLSPASRNDWMRNAAVSGSIASVLSAAALAVCGRIEEHSAAGPNNGPSQWVWGESEAYTKDFTARHTLVGYAIHHTMSVFWAGIHERFIKQALAPESSLLGNLAASGVTASLACFTDYHIARGRLQPGFEKHLSNRSLALVYTAFALGLALADVLRSADRE